MLEAKDLQAIAELLDQKLEINNESLKKEIGDSLRNEIKESNESLKKEIKENRISLKDEIITELSEIISDGFSILEAKINERPTRNEIFSWADRRIDDLEIRADRHDYFHLAELDKLPPSSEISKTLVNYKKAHNIV